jgi:hypothetical protein
MNATVLIPHTSIRRVNADGVTIFYREAGPANAPVFCCWLSPVFADRTPGSVWIPDLSRSRHTLKKSL